MRDPNAPRDLVVFLSAPPACARPALQQVRDAHGDDPNPPRITVYLRESDRKAYLDLLEGCFAYSDKPTGNKKTFIRELRNHYYDEAIVLDFGQWDFYPARCLFFLVRAEEKTVISERGRFRFGWTRPLALLKHLLHRAKNRTGAVANMPPGAPLPFALAFYRKTVGLALGEVRAVVCYGWRRLRG